MLDFNGLVLQVPWLMCPCIAVGRLLINTGDVWPAITLECSIGWMATASLLIAVENCQSLRRG